MSKGKRCTLTRKCPRLEHVQLPKNVVGQKCMKPSHSTYTVGSDSCCNGTSVMVNWDPQNRETHIAGSSVAIPGNIIFMGTGNNYGGA